MWLWLQSLQTEKEAVTDRQSEKGKSIETKRTEVHAKSTQNSKGQLIGLLWYQYHGQKEIMFPSITFLFTAFPTRRELVFKKTFLPISILQPSNYCLKGLSSPAAGWSRWSHSSHWDESSRWTRSCGLNCVQSHVCIEMSNKKSFSKQSNILPGNEDANISFQQCQNLGKNRVPSELCLCFI